ncbi:MAG: NifU family protein [Vampirovibrionales bacterium]
MDKVRIEEVLDMVRPYLQADGGNVELVDVTSEGVVMVRLQGACGTCPSATYTLKMGIEEQLKHHIPSIKEVISV